MSDREIQNPFIKPFMDRRVLYFVAFVAKGSNIDEFRWTREVTPTGT
jgi:hypothetical protein